MTLPDVNLRIVDGALGLPADATDLVQLVMGTASAGPVSTVRAVGTSDVLLNTFGSGPLVEAVALKLDAGGGPVLAVRVPATTAGTVSAVVAPTGAAPVTVTGTPSDSSDLWVRITADGARGTARFVWSLDGGVTTSVDTTTAATVPLGATGLSLAFGDGTFTTGTTYTADVEPPTFLPADLQAAFDAVLRDPREWGLVHVVGTATAGAPADRAQAAAALAALVAGRLAAAESKYRYARAIVETPAVDDGLLVSAFASYASARLAVVAGRGRVISPLDATQKWRSLAWALTLPLLRKPIGKDPAQVRAEPGTGPLPAVLTALERDEAATPNLDGQRFTTARTFIGRQGFYVTNFPLMSTVGSDFKYLQHGQVVDTACKVARGVLLEYLSADLELTPKGTLTEAQASAIDQQLDDALRAALVQPGHVTDVVARTNRTDDVLATETLRGSFRIQPRFYPKRIAFDVGFTKTVPKEA